MEGKELLDRYNIDVLMAVKFGKRQYNQDVLDGKLYLNTVDFFRKLEEENLQAKGIADKNDSCFVLQNGHLDVLDEKAEKSIISVEFMEGKFETCGNKLCFCLYLMKRENITRAYIDVTSKCLYVEAGFTEQQKASINEHFSYPNSALFILNEKEFINNICEAAVLKGSNIRYGRIHYRDNKYLTQDYLNDYKTNVDRMALYKDNYFCPQQEFRMLFDPMTLRDDHFLDYKGIVSNIFLLDIEKAYNARFVIKYKLLT